MILDHPSTFNRDDYDFVMAGHFHEPDTYIIRRPKGMRDWLITLTLSGEGYFDTGGGKRICKAGDVSLLKAGTPHEYGTVQGGKWHFIWAHFSPRDIEPVLLPDEEVTIKAVENESARKRVFRVFRNILSDSRERDDYWHDLCLIALREILMILAKKRRKKIDPRIEEAIHWLSVHMREPIRIDVLAKAVGLSPSRLSHLFKAATGQTIVETLNGMRIRQAGLLLEHTHRKASEVAQDVGFHNYNHFSNHFHLMFGMNPSEYKKTIRE